MTKEELDRFLAAVKQVGAANTASREAVRNFVEQEGYLNKDGSIASQYSSAQSVKRLACRLAQSLGQLRSGLSGV